MVQPKQAAASQAGQAVASPRLDSFPTLPPPLGYQDFYRSAYRDLVRTAMHAGATREEAEDAASKTLEDMLRIWPVPGHPLRYARKAVVHNFIKEKTRGNLRTARRVIERGNLSEVTPDGRLTDLENTEWVRDVLRGLPPAQREVMQCIADGLSREEIPGALGKNLAAVRRNLCDARARLKELLNRDGTYKQQDRTASGTPNEEAR